MSAIKFRGHNERGGANASYITRESACESISFHNLDELETGDRYDNKVNALSYAHNRQEEITKGRTHYRVVLDLKEKEDTERAKQMAHEFLEKEFPNNRAIVAIHQDTDRTHAHVWIDAKNIDKGKVNSSDARIEQLCQAWQKQCDREYKTDRAREFAEKRAETKQWEKEYAIAKEQGLPTPEKPERAAEMKPQQYREKDARDTGVSINDEEGFRGNQRHFEVRDSQTKAADRAIVGSEYQVEQSEHRVEQSERNINKSGEQLEQSTSNIDRAGESLRRAESAFTETRERFDDVREQSRELENEIEKSDERSKDYGRDF